MSRSRTKIGIVGCGNISVLDIMHAILESAREGRHIELSSICIRPEPLPMELREGRLDE